MGYFTDWLTTRGVEVVPGDVVWSATGDQLQMIRAEIAPNSVFALHSHPQEQMILVQEGTLEFTVGTVTEVVHATGVICIPAGQLHGGRVLGTNRVVTIEAFHPPRRDFHHPSISTDLNSPS